MKFLLIPALLFCFNNLFAQDIQDCLNKSKNFFEQKEYLYAQKTLESCLKNNPKNRDILLSLGAVNIKQNNFDTALTYFKEALEDKKNNNYYKAYIYARMGDCYINKKAFEEAEKYYDFSLNLNSEDVNSLIGKGICEEKQGKIIIAANYYKKALALDYTNNLARERLIVSEPDALSYEEKLTIMKERNILDPNAIIYQDQDLTLLKKMLKAEQDKAIQYLNTKYNNKIPQGLIVEQYYGNLEPRKMLTYSGYKDLMFLLSKDAINFFIKEGAYKSEILKLRDFDGNNIFDDKGILTDEGLTAYTFSLNGQKAYLLPKEPLPAEIKKANILVKQLISQGYEEISLSEYAYLIEKSRCSEKTLTENGVKIIPSLPGKNRFLIIDQLKKPSKFGCPVDVQACFYNIVQEKRKEKKGSSSTPVYKSTFGTGTLQTYLCKEDGTLATFGK